MKEQNEFLMERYDLAIERIRQIKEESYGDEQLDLYFSSVAEFIEKADDYYQFVQRGGLLDAGLEELQRRNHTLYNDILPENYETDYTNPAYAVEKLGKEYGTFFSVIAAEMRSMILPATEESLEEVLIRMELFVEIYGVCAYEWQENGLRPEYESLRQILYWYVSDYTDITEEEKIRKLLFPEENTAVQIIMTADLTKPEYLYRYGELVSDNELKTAEFMAGLQQENIDLMANTYTEACCRDWVQVKKDISKKKTVELRYSLGYERIIRRVMENFAAMGLTPVVRRTPAGILQGGGLEKAGSIGSIPNNQYAFDHKEDIALVWDKAMVQRKLEVRGTVFEKYRKDVSFHAGTTTGRNTEEKSFIPVRKQEVLTLSPEQQKLLAEYCAQADCEDLNEPFDE